MLLKVKLLNTLCKSRPTLSVGQQMIRRLATTVSDSPMAQLRRKTGYAFTLCRKALDIHSQDIEKAEQWLRAEAARQGWERAERVATRPVAEGLIGVMSTPDHRMAAMLELNCETDFVARNQLFNKLASDLTKRLAQQLGSGAGSVQHSDAGSQISKIVVSAEQLNAMAPELIVEAIGKLGENIRLSKACLVFNNTGAVAHNIISDGPVYLITYTHAVGGRIEANEDSVLSGKYGTIVALKCGPFVNELGEMVTKTGEEVLEIGKQVSQHIIGMNPKTIAPLVKLLETNPSYATKLSEVVDSNVEKEQPVMTEDSEPTSLLQQQFVFDEDLTVGEFLNQSNIKVLDFVRFECGVTD